MTLPFSHFIVHGLSMIPTLNPGQHVLTSNCFNHIREVDLVVAKIEGKNIIKRVKKVDERKVFLTGDNEVASTDSRKFGWIPMDSIVGKVSLIL